MTPRREITDNGLDAVANLATLADQIQILDGLVRQEVKAAIWGGASWRDVGNALGTSPQAAWERWHHFPQMK